MVGNRNHPLNQRHYDDDTLEEFVLGQLLPDEEEQIRQHLANCPLCRATAAEIHAFCQRVTSELHHDLEATPPGPHLSFDRVATEWRKPPRRVTFTFKLQQLIPGASYLLLVVLLTAAFVVLFPSSDTAALDRLDLVNDYTGPPAVVAAMTEEGLVVVQLTPDDTQVLTLLTNVRDPQNLQFSPDGQWLAFQDRSTLHIIQPMGDEVWIRVYVHDRAEWTWSPDSQKLAYTNGIGQLAIFDVATQTNHVVVPADESAWGMPVWTDDSAQIAYTVVQPLPTENDTVNRQGIWRITLDTGYRVEMARNTTPSEKLLAPVDWSSDNTLLLAWDMNAGTDQQTPNLYRVTVEGHEIIPLEGHVLAQGSQLAWPVSSLDTTLAFQSGTLSPLNLTDDAPSMLISDQIPWPHVFDWSPTGAWMAYTVAGEVEGQGVYLYAPQEAESRQITLPDGAIEKAVYWAGAEHLFVVRQRPNSFVSELWLVSLTTNESPQRIMTHIKLPHTNEYNGLPWQNVLAMKVVN